MAERTVAQVDEELMTRTSRRKALREEREELKLKLWISEEEMGRLLKAATQRIDAQTEAIARLMDERADAEVRETPIPDTPLELLMEEGTA